MKNQLLAKTCKTALIFCRQHKSTILSCVSAVGVVATGVLSARGGIKAEKIIAAENFEQDESDAANDCEKTLNRGLVDIYRTRHPKSDLSDECIVNLCMKRAKRKDAAKRIFPFLLLPVLTATGTIALIFVTDAQNRQAQAALAGAYAMMAKKLADFKGAVANVAGPEAVLDSEEFLAKERLKDNDILAEERAEGAKLWYDNFSERFFWATDAEVSDAEYYVNRLFRMQGYAMLNDLYRLLHLDEIPEGDELGWEEYLGETQYGYTWIDFKHFDHKGDKETTPYTELFIDFGPHPFFDELAEMEAEYQKIVQIA